jgi:hypothetical protein
MNLFLGTTTAKGAVDVPYTDETGAVVTDPVTGRPQTKRQQIGYDGPRVTVIAFPEDVYSLAEIVVGITSREGIVFAHMHEVPVFVAVPSNPGVEQMLAQSFGCPAGVPADWDGPSLTDAASDAIASAPDQDTADAIADGGQ